MPACLQVAMLFLGCVTGAGDTFSVGRPAAVYRDFMQGWPALHPCIMQGWPALPL